MLTKANNELHTIWIVYDCGAGYTDIKLPDKGLLRFNFGLPYIEEKLLTHNEYIKLINSCCIEFIHESVFDDKYLAYKRWQELLNKRVKSINIFLGE